MWNFTTQRIWQQVPTQIQGGCTIVSPAPHPLLFPVWTQHSLTHYVVVRQLTKALSSSTPRRRNCTKAQETAGTSSSSMSSLKMADRKSPAPLVTGRTPGGHEWLVRPEWQEHLPWGYNVLKNTAWWFLAIPSPPSKIFSRSPKICISIALAPALNQTLL